MTAKHASGASYTRSSEGRGRASTKAARSIRSMTNVREEIGPQRIAL